MINEKELGLLRNRIKEKFSSIFVGVNFKDTLAWQKKGDQSPVTEIDLFISNEIKTLLQRHKTFSEFHFFSEEDQESFNFPCAILDPLDGTRDLLRGHPECAVSLALMSSASEGHAWIFNPFTGFEISSATPFCLPPAYPTGNLIGQVSRSEWEKDLFKGDSLQGITIYPKGSIAFKLGMLAAGACDFVITKRGKNVWDIAAGTLLCWSREISFFQNGKEIKALSDIRYDKSMVWCRKQHLDPILKNFSC